MSALNSIYAQLDGRHGTLYMESYSENSGQVTFKTRAAVRKIWPRLTEAASLKLPRRKHRKAEAECTQKQMVLFRPMPMETRPIPMLPESRRRSVMSINYTDEMAILLPMDTAILHPYTGLTSISDTDDGNIAQFRPWFDGRN
mgnify:CR=1 FL=1